MLVFFFRTNFRKSREEAKKRKWELNHVFQEMWAPKLSWGEGRGYNWV
jgi:hypothetical protein